MKIISIIALAVLALKGSDYIGEKVQPTALACTLGGLFAAACIGLCVWLLSRLLGLDQQPSSLNSDTHEN